jgi:hypothetical protein
MGMIAQVRMGMMVAMGMVAQGEGALLLSVRL